MQIRENAFARPSRLMVLPFLILAGLYIAPPTRALLQAQLSLLHDISPFLARLREMGVREGPPAPAPTWQQSPTAVSVSRFPDDYAVQLGGALLEGTYIDGGATKTPQESFANFQHRYGERLAALQARFPDRPGLYAHTLRYMTIPTQGTGYITMGAVGVSRDAEVEKFQTGKNPNGLQDRQKGYAESWAVFDNAAAQGEKWDPDNAYFPMMRAIGLFDAKRDAEGIAAVLRAGQKKRFNDYSLEEPEAEWTLYLRSYGETSVLVRQSIYGVTPLPHLGALRALSRMTAYEAEKAEQQGRTQEGLALRHAMMQCGLHMREQGSIFTVLEGIAIISIQTNRPGAGPLVAPPANLTSDQRSDWHGDLYRAYLYKIGEDEERRWFTQLDAGNRQVRSLIHAAAENNLVDDATRPLPALWMVDMLLLANMLAMLLLSSAAMVCARVSWGGKALPVVVVVLGALCLLVALRMQWAEALTQMRKVLENLALLSWSSEQRSPTSDLADLVTRFPWMVHIGEVLFALLMPALVLLSVGVVSLIRREAFTVALSGRLQRASLSVTTLLVVAYAGCLIATTRAEAHFGAVLDGMAYHSVYDIRQQAELKHKP